MYFAREQQGPGEGIVLHCYTGVKNSMHLPRHFWRATLANVWGA